MKPAKKVHTSAIVIIPPPSCFPPIQEIRAKYDKSYERWMPHINLIYPFYEDLEFENIEKRVEERLREENSFPLRFSTFNYFQHGANSSTVWLSPFEEYENETSKGVLKLQKALEEIFPDCDDLSTKSENGFIPHLSVGQFKSERHTKEMIEKFQSNWNLSPFIVEYIYIISRRGNDPFQIRKAIPLGKLVNSPPAFDIVPLPVYSEKLGKMFISNIDFSVKNSGELEAFLKNYFPQVENVCLLMDRATKRSKGCGFFEVPESQMQNALDFAQEINGRSVRVQLSEPRQ